MTMKIHDNRVRVMMPEPSQIHWSWAPLDASEVTQGLYTVDDVQALAQWSDRYTLIAILPTPERTEEPREAWKLRLTSEAYKLALSDPNYRPDKDGVHVMRINLACAAVFTVRTHHPVPYTYGISMFAAINRR